MLDAGNWEVKIKICVKMTSLISEFRPGMWRVDEVAQIKSKKMREAQCEASPLMENLSTLLEGELRSRPVAAGRWRQL